VAAFLSSRFPISIVCTLPVLSSRFPSPQKHICELCACASCHRPSSSTAPPKLRRPPGPARSRGPHSSPTCTCTASPAHTRSASTSTSHLRFASPSRSSSLAGPHRGRRVRARAVSEGAGGSYLFPASPRACHLSERDFRSFTQGVPSFLPFGRESRKTAPEAIEESIPNSPTYKPNCPERAGWWSGSTQTRSPRLEPAT
jgi:hypothetical protein